MKKNDKANERRWRRRHEAVGTSNFVCVMCGCTDIVTAEGHHIAGKHFDSHVEYFCANCHCRLTDAQKSRPRPTSKDPGPVERAGHYCVGVGDILGPVARMLD